MAKNLKINIKNTQIAKAVNLGGLKEKLAKRKAEDETEEPSSDKKTSHNSPVKTKAKAKTASKSAVKEKKSSEKSAATKKVESAPKVRARSKSAFAKKEESSEHEEAIASPPPPPQEELKQPVEEKEKVVKAEDLPPPEIETISTSKAESKAPAKKIGSIRTEFGPTGKHIRDLIPAKKKAPEKSQEKKERPTSTTSSSKQAETTPGNKFGDDNRDSKKPNFGKNKPKFKEFKEFKSPKRRNTLGSDPLGHSDQPARWRKKKSKKGNQPTEDLTIRPKNLSIRIPISIKALASDMKLKASQLIQKLFLQGIAVTLNDYLDDETTIQLLGEEFGCEIKINTSEEERIRITDESVQDEIKNAEEEKLSPRAPVIAFMGHVDHGKTSLIDYIRKSNITAGEAGEITQHIGAFRCHTEQGDVTVLDTPGHEAFSAMRARGANVTDIVVLVVAGDEGLKEQTNEAIEHAQAAAVPIVVAINKCDKPNFNPENVYRQLSDRNLLPEAWGGEVITVNCSAATGEGVDTLLEMLALQSEVMELKACTSHRARGSVLESQMHKGLGSIATLLVQNGTLKHGDPLVFGTHWGRIKTMTDDNNQAIQTAPPSTPVRITGLSGVPEAGEEFIVVKSEKEAKNIAETRQEQYKEKFIQKKKSLTLESLLQEASEESNMKTLNIILRTDVQGSLEALKVAIEKIESDKVVANIISSGVGEISESDILLSAASKAVIIGFHTQVESHAEPLIKQHGVIIKLYDIIYHAVDEIKILMQGLLDKTAEEKELGKADVKMVFKASQLGKIAGCQIADGIVRRNSSVRLVRDGEVVWKGSIASIKREKDDVREVKSGFECGIVLQGFNDIKEGDIIEAYEVIYLEQEL